MIAEMISSSWVATTQWFFFAMDLIYSLWVLLLLTFGPYFGAKRPYLWGNMSALSSCHWLGNGGNTTPAGQSFWAEMSGIMSLIRGFGIPCTALTPDPSPERFPTFFLFPEAAGEFYFCMVTGGGGVQGSLGKSTCWAWPGSLWVNIGHPSGRC